MKKLEAKMHEKLDLPLSGNSMAMLPSKNESLNSKLGDERDLSNGFLFVNGSTLTHC